MRFFEPDLRRFLPGRRRSSFGASVPNRQKLPLAWIAMLAVSMLLAGTGCAIGGRKSILTTKEISPRSVAPARMDSLVKQVPPSTPADKSDTQTSSTIVCLVDEQPDTQRRLAPAGCDQKSRIEPTAWIPGEGAEEGDTGIYLSGGSTIRNWPAAIGSTGVIHLPTPWTTLRCGVMGADNDGIGVAGVEAGVRLHAATRFTPYIGLSTDLGISGFHSGHRHQGNANTPPTNVTQLAGLAALGSEAGVSYWVTPWMRLNAGATYFVAARQSDFLLFGLSTEFLLPDRLYSRGSSVPQRVPIDDSDDDPGDPYFVDIKGLIDPMDLIRKRIASRKQADAPAERIDTDDEPGEPIAAPNDLPPLLVPQQDAFEPNPPQPIQKSIESF